MSEADIAVHFLQAIGGAEFMPDSGQALVDSVRAWLRRSKLDHRLGDAVDIAIEVFEIGRQVTAQQLPTPEQTQWANDQASGIGDPTLELALRLADDRALAARVQAMDHKQFSEFRKQAGLQRDLASFLGGS